MMFKFQQLQKKGSLSLQDICVSHTRSTVKKTLEKYGTTGQTLTVVDVFDRRADCMKGATEQSRGDAPPTALDFTANVEVDHQLFITVER